MNINTNVQYFFGYSKTILYIYESGALTGPEMIKPIWREPRRYGG